MYCVIMAGGSGTRFWPYSRHTRPKQLLKIVGETSMLQMTVDRLKKINTVQDIFIVTRQDLADTIKEEITGVKPENIIIEPSGKNTAPCIGLSALKISKLEKNAVMGIFPADHLIVGHNDFAKALTTAKYITLKKNALVTIGLKPTFPSTGYGYIQYDLDSDSDHLDAYKVKVFAEKPHLSLAEKFIESGDFLWNSGMFIWSVDIFFKNLQKHMPDLFHQLRQIDKLIKAGKDFKEVWERIKPVSIDYGLMEKAKGVYLIKAKFEWSDLGSWNTVYDHTHKTDEGNAIKGDGIVLNGKNNFIQSNNRLTAIVGLDNIVVVNTNDATLVISKEHVEDIKKLVEHIKKQNRKELL
ncbi:NTP transferase domain-containing protein [bacterium]|nr:NTP transferase domain-containing protein [bacterium]